MLTSYLDFDLRIERFGDGYRTRVINSPAGEAVADFERPFSALETENFNLRMINSIGALREGVRRLESAEREAARTFGGGMFAAVFTGDVLASLRASLGEAQRRGAGLRVRLRLADVPELAGLPWECLYNPGVNRFLALSPETPLVRYLDLPESTRGLGVSPPLRMIAMISSPSDYPELDVEEEWRKLDEATAAMQEDGRIVLERLEEATLSALQRRLRTGDYHVFHFIGHGGFVESAQDGALVLEDGRRRARLVSGEDLGVILHGYRPLRLVMLNACEGARGSATDPFSGAAQSLVQQGIPAVIAMQFRITDRAAILFAEEFYGALTLGVPVDAALTEARRGLFAAGHDVEWAVPVLYMRSPNGRLFRLAARPRSALVVDQPAAPEVPRQSPAAIEMPAAAGPSAPGEQLVTAEAVSAPTPAAGPIEPEPVIGVVPSHVEDAPQAEPFEGRDDAPAAPPHAEPVEADGGIVGLAPSSVNAEPPSKATDTLSAPREPSWREPGAVHPDVTAVPHTGEAMPVSSAAEGDSATRTPSASQPATTESRPARSPGLWLALAAGALLLSSLLLEVGTVRGSSTWLIEVSPSLWIPWVVAGGGVALAGWRLKRRYDTGTLGVIAGLATGAILGALGYLLEFPNHLFGYRIYGVGAGIYVALFGAVAGLASLILFARSGGLEESGYLDRGRMAAWVFVLAWGGAALGLLATFALPLRASAPGSIATAGGPQGGITLMAVLAAILAVTWLRNPARLRFGSGFLLGLGALSVLGTLGLDYYLIEAGDETGAGVAALLMAWVCLFVAGWLGWRASRSEHRPPASTNGRT